jgi:beta-lactamase regulating signal transducer with metallopeptidase domain
MRNLVSIAFAYAVNALWLLPVLVLAAEATTKLCRGLRASLLHRIWVTCFTLALVFPALPFFAPVHNGALRSRASVSWSDFQDTLNGALHRESTRASEHISDSSQASAPLKDPAKKTGLPQFLAALPNWLVVLYLASILFAILRVAFGLWRTRTLVQGSIKAPVTGEWQRTWESCLTTCGVKRVQLLISDKISSPATIHWPRALVIFPAGLLEVETSQMTAAFCHELAHVRRRDFEFNFLCEVFGSLLFFHPALHWIRAKLRQTRELACDDLAAEAMSGRQVYAQNLLRLAKKLQSVAGAQPQSYALGIFEGEMLEERIMNLMERKTLLSRARKWLAVIAGASLLLASGMVAASFGMTPLAAETSSRTDHAPAGWFKAGTKPQSYRTGVDHAVMYDGQPSAYLQSVEPVSNGFGTLMQSISATKYTGKRIRLRAWVKSQDVADWAGVWMRVDKGETMGVAFDNMENRPIKGTQSWKMCEVVLNVPDDATGISFGILLSGTGEVWLNQATFEEVGNSVAVTGSKPLHVSETPVNLSFTQ